MKSLALENYGVEEMNHAEMQEVDGGKWWGALAGAVIGFCVGGPVGMIAGGIAGDVLSGQTGSSQPSGYNVPVE